MDHKACDAFAAVFGGLAEDQLLYRAPEQVRTLARKLWRHTIHFDFAPHQMYCADALVALELAWRVPNKYNPDETELEYASR